MASAAQAVLNGRGIRIDDCQTICSFSASVLAIFCNRRPLAQIRDFGGFFKTLIFNHLNFIDTILGPKIGLKEPKRACKMATVARQLWPFWLSTVALLQARWARMRKSVGFSDGLRQVFRSGWRVFTEVLLLILFVTTRCLQGLPSAFFIGYVSNTQIGFTIRYQPPLMASFLKSEVIEI